VKIASHLGVVRLAEMLLDDLARLSLTPDARQPPRRLGQALAQQQRRQAGDRAGGEDHCQDTPRPFST